MYYGTIIIKPYSVPVLVRRDTLEELFKDFPYVKIIRR